MDSAGGWPIRRPLKFAAANSRQLYYTEGGFAGNKADSLEYKTERHYIDKDSVYIVATNDYLANGGDNCSFLQTCKRQNTGILLRDLMITYIRKNKLLYPAGNYQMND